MMTVTTNTFLLRQSSAQGGVWRAAGQSFVLLIVLVLTTATCTPIMFAAAASSLTSKLVLKGGGSRRAIPSSAAFASSPRARQVYKAMHTLTLRDDTLLPSPGGVDPSTGGGSRFDVLDPGAQDDGAVVYTVEKMGREHAQIAIETSQKAFLSWRETTGQYRAGILNKWCQLLEENKEDLAAIMTMESGKPLQESRGEVSYASSFLSFFAAEAIRPTSAGGGTIIPTPFTQDDGKSPRGQIMAYKEAVGVTAMITPWNFPLAMITRKVGPALAAGCTAVVKPSELTPLSAIAARELALKAGVPDGVFELVTASDRDSSSAVGQEFCVNGHIKKISFTGSTAVGKILMKQSSDTVKRASMELGGNAPFIVFPDADIDQAVKAAIASKYRNAGQTCVCADRFLVHTHVEDEFVSKLAQAVKNLKVGHGMEEGTTMGPMITPTAVASVDEKVKEAIAEGAECVIGGNPLPDLGPNYYEPTILRNVNPRVSRIWHTETFGPVAPIVPFDSDDEAVALANDSPVGLASYFCTKDMARAFRVAKSLESGMVGVNEGVISNAAAPFGGVKESGLGREGSSVGIDEYLETKYVFMNT